METTKKVKTIASVPKDIEDCLIFVLEHLGLKIDNIACANALKSLNLMARREGFGSVSDLLQRVWKEYSHTEKLQFFASLFTVGETYFFRDMKVLEIVERYVIPNRLEQKIAKGDKLLMRAWSAGCSTGEEAYTLAAIFEEARKWDSRGWDYTIIATDINKASIEQARKGVYRPWSFRKDPPQRYLKYFSFSNNCWEVAPQIKKRVHFFVLNLMENLYPSLHTSTVGLDLIMCRNVIMYFSEDKRQYVLDRFYRSLSPGGWLVLAMPELPWADSKKWKRFKVNGVTLLKKPDNLSNVAKIKGANSRSRVEINTKACHSSKASDIDDETSAFVAPDKDKIFSEFRRLVAENRFEEAKQALFRHIVIDRGNCFSSQDIYNLLDPFVRTMIDSGRCTEALTFVEQLTEYCKFEPALYIIKAFLYRELDRLDEAIVAYRQAIYLNPDAISPMLFLASTYQMVGRKDLARRYWRKAYDLLLKKQDKNEVLPYGETMTVSEAITTLEWFLKDVRWRRESYLIESGSSNGGNGAFE
ncbi:MAG: hypothetical protein JRI45_10085 [Deltaproteobacteria bacterium]|nr:hypothetical protein [Deltaproteobacteria bacterium]